MGEVDEVFRVVWVCWAVDGDEGCEWGSLVVNGLVRMWFVLAWWVVGMGRRCRELLFVALLMRVWLLVLTGMRVGSCTEDLRLMVVRMMWVVAGGSSGSRSVFRVCVRVCVAFGLCGVELVLGCVVVFVSSGGW